MRSVTAAILWCATTICWLSGTEFAIAVGAAVKTIAAINAGGPTIQTADGTVYEQDR